MSGTSSQSKTYSLIEHPRIRKSMYIPGTNPENTFWALFHEWSHGLLDTACRGISWDKRCRIEISTSEDRALLHVSGGEMPHKIHSIMTNIIKSRHIKLNDFCPCKGGIFTCSEVGETIDAFLLPIWLVLAYSEDVTIAAAYNRNLVEVNIYHDEVVGQSCHDSDEDDFFQLQFKSDSRFISGMPIGSAFRAECFRRVCAYGEALAICVNGLEMHEKTGTRAWLNLIAPSHIGK